MNKSDLISAIAEESGLSKTISGKALDGFTKAITKALKKNEKVVLVGFGTFYVGERAARDGRNPKTGAIIKIKAGKYPKFKAGKTLKESI